MTCIASSSFLIVSARMPPVCLRRGLMVEARAVEATGQQPFRGFRRTSLSSRPNPDPSVPDRPQERCPSPYWVERDRGRSNPVNTRRCDA